ncbi:MAG: dehydrogenase [Gemmatimonadetes bacterium]|nr:dehydrogenase [Gemmatimonadota bacterium]
MRYLVLRMADEETEAGVMPSEAMLRAMGDYMEEMSKAGVLLGGEGLHPSSKAKKIKFSAGRPTVIDGPFAEAKELIAGYAMIQVKSEQEAIDWVKRWPPMDAGGNVQIELRRIFEADDFGEEFTPELREREERMRVEAAKQA